MPHARTRLRALVVAVLAIAVTGGTAGVAHAEPSAGELTKKIDKASDQLEQVTEDYNRKKIAYDRTVAEGKRLAASLEPSRKALAEASAQVQVIAAADYKTGEIGAVNLMLDGGGDLMTRLDYMDQIRRDRQRDIETYTVRTRDFDKLQAANKTVQAKQAAELKELTAHKKKIADDLKKLYAMRRAAYGQAEETPTRGSAGPAPSLPGDAGEAVAYAYAAVNRGAMYRPGASGPNYYDCSGLTSAAYGGKLYHHAATQYRETSRISRGQLAPGDLVFYNNPGYLGHVALYVGGGQIIDASRPGKPVRKRDMDLGGSMTIAGYGRVR